MMGKGGYRNGNGTHKSLVTKWSAGHIISGMNQRISIQGLKDSTDISPGGYTACPDACGHHLPF